MTKVLHFITSLQVGGAEKMLLKTLPHLSPDIKNRVCCLTGPGKIGEELKLFEIPVTYLNYRHFTDLPRVIADFKKEVLDFAPDILITYLIHCDLLGRVLGRYFKIKKIYCSVRADLSRSGYFPLFLLDGISSFLVDRYHFNSETVADKYHRCLFLPKNKITVIPNGVNPLVFNPKIVSGTDNKPKLGIPPDQLVVGCIAKLRPQKGIFLLLTAFMKVHKINNNTCLVLVGDGPLRNAVNSTVGKLGLKDSVILLGDRHDVPEILKIFDIFVLPSFYEGMSNSILEAMSAGLPVIVSNIPENNEIVTDGKNGLICNINPQLFSQKIIDLLNNRPLRKYLGINARKTVINNYAIAKTYPKWNNFIIS